MMDYNSTADSPSMGRSPLARTGSQRSSLLVRDRRSTRRAQAPSIAKPQATPTAATDGVKSDDSRSAISDNYKLENDGLRSMLEEANEKIATMKKQTVALQQQLSQKSADVDRLSNELCSLRNRLLKDNALKYLERK